MKRVCLALFVSVIASAALTTPLHADVLGSLAGLVPSGEGFTCSMEGGVLPNSADYEWWYGCSATAAGMMMGHYDRNGYDGKDYGNLVPGEIAESTTYPETQAWDAEAKSMIASEGHAGAFYVNGYGASGDDFTGSVATRPVSDFNSLADFMGTSQDSVVNINGGTKFFFYSSDPSNAGGKTYPSDVVEILDLVYELYNYDQPHEDYSGMIGIGEYVQHAGYQVETLYNQVTDSYITSYYGPSAEAWPDPETNPYTQVLGKGFTFDEFKAEIDAGRPVLLHADVAIDGESQLVGHSMYGYGYDESTETIYFHDTWSEGQKSMAWDSWEDGAYTTYFPEGDVNVSVYLKGVTVLELSGGSPPNPGGVVIPEPTSFAVWSLLAVVGLVSASRRNRG